MGVENVSGPPGQTTEKLGRKDDKMQPETGLLDPFTVQQGGVSIGLASRLAEYEGGHPQKAAKQRGAFGRAPLNLGAVGYAMLCVSRLNRKLDSK